MFSGIQKHHGGTTMTELEKAANDFFPIDEKTMNLDEQSDQLLRQIGFKFGANWQKEQFEKERLKHCDELTAEQAQMESDFVVQHLKNFNRTPTFIDAIEYGRKIMIDKACEWIKKKWDAENKRLKKTEDEIEIPFGAKDSELQEVTYYIPKGFHAEIDDDKVVIKKGEKSAKWSDEDEENLQHCCMAISADGLHTYEDKQDMEAWLKSLKDRIGG